MSPLKYLCCKAPPLSQSQAPCCNTCTSKPLQYYWKCFRFVETPILKLKLYDCEFREKLEFWTQQDAICKWQSLSWCPAQETQRPSLVERTLSKESTFIRLFSKRRYKEWAEVCQKKLSLYAIWCEHTSMFDAAGQFWLPWIYPELWGISLWRGKDNCDLRWEKR